ncbi:thymidylate kinase [Methylophaga lonarensis MPL]|uniref:Thymidylate kinase n=1 Tax=Methylophaga lonarensis MPL TaxID=1286106 RepID=M7NVW9_9GAMM|nr:dTMP kinase [Methylophaga lonarensis]EMR12918.1 thymidylate kinase [Methylophaga lonarensis MPL]
MKGKFISIEGIEGAGKSTQMSVISDYLNRHQIPHIITREPGGTPLAEEIREILLKPRESGMSIDTELLLMFASRAEHLNTKILPALNVGQWVISDRFVDATFAYQGGGRGVAEQRIQALADWTLQGLMPDLTLLFDLPVETGQQRVRQRAAALDRFEQEKVEFFEKIRNCYLQRANQSPDRISVIDASQALGSVETAVRAALDKLRLS